MCGKCDLSTESTYLITSPFPGRAQRRGMQPQRPQRRRKTRMSHGSVSGMPRASPAPNLRITGALATTTRRRLASTTRLHECIWAAYILTSSKLSKQHLHCNSVKAGLAPALLRRHEWGAWCCVLPAVLTFTFISTK